MSALKRTFSLFLVVVAVGSMWFWIGGCDFSAVDDGAGATATAHIEALATVTNQADAETAIRRFFNKIGAVDQERPGLQKSPYFGFALTNDRVRQLAAAQVRFNKGDESAGLAVSEVYTVLDQPTLIESVFPMRTESNSVELVDVLTALRISAKHAMEAPEAPDNAILLAIVADRDGVPGEVPLFGITKVLSPVQGTLFGMWLHKKGSTIPAFSSEDGSSKGTEKGGGNASCPAGQVLIAKFNTTDGGAYVFEKPNGNQSVVSISGDLKSADWTSSIPVSTVIVKGATDNDFFTYDPPLSSGTFNNSGLTNGGGRTPAISNVQFCAGYTPPPDDCYKNCIAKYIVNLLVCSSSPNKQACELEALETARKCGNDCHDQGVSAPSWWSF